MDLTQTKGLSCAYLLSAYISQRGCCLKLLYLSSLSSEGVRWCAVVHVCLKMCGFSLQNIHTQTQWQWKIYHSEIILIPVPYPSPQLALVFFHVLAFAKQAPVSDGWSLNSPNFGGGWREV